MGTHPSFRGRPGALQQAGQGRTTAHKEEGFRCEWPGLPQRRPLGSRARQEAPTPWAAEPSAELSTRTDTRAQVQDPGPGRRVTCHVSALTSQPLREADPTPVRVAENMRLRSSPGSDRSWLSPSPLRLPLGKAGAVKLTRGRRGRSPRGGCLLCRMAGAVCTTTAISSTLPKPAY